MYAIRGPIGLGLMAAVLLAAFEPQLLAFGGKTGGGSPHRAAPHVSSRPQRSPRNAYHPPKFSSQARPRVNSPRPVQRSSRPATRPKTTAKKATPRVASPNKPATRAVVKTPRTSTARPRSVTTRSYSRVHSRHYVRRSGVRRYRGYGYSRRYATSNQNLRSIVQRLRSTHSSLARLDRDYGGHRLRAMSSISRAVRQLSHRSIGRSRNQNGRAIAGRNRANVAIRPVSQVQSDSRMRQALQTLQGVHGVLTSSATMPSHFYASGSIRRAMRELTLALHVR